MKTLLNRCTVSIYGGHANIQAPDVVTVQALIDLMPQWNDDLGVTIRHEEEILFQMDELDEKRIAADRFYDSAERSEGLRQSIENHLSPEFHHLLDECDISWCGDVIQVRKQGREEAIALVLSLPAHFGPVLRGLGFEQLLITDPLRYVRSFTRRCCDLLHSWYLREESDNQVALEAIAAAPISEPLREVLAGCTIEVLRYIGGSHPLDIEISANSAEAHAYLMAWAWELVAYLPYAKFHLSNAQGKEYKIIPRDELLATYRQRRAALTRLMTGF